jgi:Flp pilus assembly pilin Flp
MQNHSFNNQRGQGLIEYLVIVALMGVATIAIVRVMGQTVSSRFASVTAALQGKQKKFDTPEITKTTYQKRDLGSFMEGSGETGGGNSKRSGR